MPPSSASKAQAKLPHRSLKERLFGPSQSHSRPPNATIQDHGLSTQVGQGSTASEASTSTIKENVTTLTQENKLDPQRSGVSVEGIRPSDDGLSKIDSIASPISTEDHSSPAVIKSSIWDQAYEALLTKDLDLVTRYELLVKSELLPPDIRLDNENMDGVPVKSVLRPDQRHSYLNQMLVKDPQPDKGKLLIAGHSISIVSILERTSSVILLSKDWIDSAVAASPQASVAWSVICLALPLLTRPGEAQKINFDGFDYVSSRMLYYIAMEGLMVPTTLSQDSEGVSRYGALENSREAQGRIKTELISLYTKIIDFQVKSILRFHKSTIRVIANDIWNKYDWKEMLESIKSLEDLIHGDLLKLNTGEAAHSLSMLLQNARESQSILQHLLEQQLLVAKEQLEISQNILQVSQQANNREMNQEEAACLQLFCLEPSYELFKSRVPDRLPGTCEWLLGSQKYKTWLSNSTTGNLLITADPGCGKSVLAKYMIEEKLPIACAGSNICYFFFVEKQQSRLSTALSALLHQLPEQTLLEHALPVVRKNGKSLISNSKALFSILCDAVKSSTRPTILVLDALDECDRADREDLLRWLRTESVSLSGKLKVLITSRPYDNIISHYDMEDDPWSQQIAVGLDTAGLSTEIEAVISMRLDKLGNQRPRRLDEKTRVILENTLKTTEHQTYLWVHLVFDELENAAKKSPGELRKFLDKIPKSVAEAYERVLARVICDEDTRSRAYKMFQIILANADLLSVEELQIALKISPDMQSEMDLNDELDSEEDFANTVRQSCGSFIQIHEGKVSFFHLTARAFLIDQTCSLSPDVHTTNTAWKGSISMRQAHTVSARSCILYLHLDEVKKAPQYLSQWREDDKLEPTSPIDEDHESTNNKDNLNDDCTSDNLSEYEDSDIEDDEEKMEARIRASYARFYNIEDNTPITKLFTRFPFIRYAAYYWNEHFERGLFETDQIILQQALDLCNPTHEAFSSMSMVGMYIDEASDDLEIACKLRSKKLVTCLIGQRKGERSQEHINRALILICYYKDEEVADIARELLANGASPNCTEDPRDGETALMIACRSSTRDLIELLLSAGADVEAVDCGGQNALSRFCSDPILIKRLVQQGANINIRDQYGLTPLHNACKLGSSAIVKALLSCGADPHAKDDRENTSLMFAAESESTEVLEALLDLQVDINTKNANEETALELAVAGTILPNVRFLLQRGAIVDYPILQRACMRQSVEILELLLQHSMDMDGRCQAINGLLMLTPYRDIRPRRLVQVLLKYGADPNVQDQDRGTTVLHEAACYNSMAAVKALINGGANPTITDVDGFTPLQTAKQTLDSGLSVEGYPQTPKTRLRLRRLVKLLEDAEQSWYQVQLRTQVVQTTIEN